jgi:hypothetical protein
LWVTVTVGASAFAALRGHPKPAKGGHLKSGHRRPGWAGR